MSIPEMIILVRQTVHLLRQIGQENSDIIIEYRRGEPRHVRFDLEVKPDYNIGIQNDLEKQA